MANLREITVHIQLTTLGCEVAGESPDAEPFLWITYFKIDGDSVILSEELTLSGTCTLAPRSTVWFKGMADGAVKPIPLVLGEEPILRPGFQTQLKPIPLQTPILGITHVAGTLGCVVVLWEEDGTAQDAREAGQTAFNEVLRKELNRLIPTLGFSKPQPTEEDIKRIGDRVKEAVEKAIRAKMDIWDWFVAPFGDFDDPLGTASFLFSHQQLQDATERIPLSKIWTEEDTKQSGKWQLDGFVERIQSCLAAAALPDEDGRLRQLRSFRDRYVRRRAWGPAAIRAYSTLGGLVAPAIARSSVLQALARALVINPAVALSAWLQPAPAGVRRRNRKRRSDATVRKE
jgi:hypothetical protein